MKKIKKIRGIVHGFVQGVGFRFFVFQQGKTLNLRGWVRNRLDGTVEILAQGIEDDLSLLIEAVKRGPPGSLVSDVDTTWIEPSESLPSFTILETK